VSDGQKRALQLALGLAVSGAVIWWAFREIDWQASWQYIVTAHRSWVLLAVVLATLPFPLRVPRWRLLLRHEDGHPVPRAPLWHAIAIGFAANNVLPFRAGEVLRVAAASQLGRVPFATVLSSVAVERVMDALVAAGLLSMALVLADIDPSLTLSEGGRPIAAVANTVGLLGLAALAVAALMAWQRTHAIALLRRLLPASRVGEALVHFAERILLGIAALGRPSTGLAVIAWSLVVWLCNAASFQAMFHAFGFAIPFTGALILQGALMIGIALPQAPGYVGVFETAMAGTLATLYGVPLEAGFAYGLLYHVTTFIPITLLGAWSAVTTGIRRTAASEAAS
jgi:glycosyltransferase 2 family protein